MLLFIFLFSVFRTCFAGNSSLQEEGCKNGFNCTRRLQNSPACPAGFFCPNGSTSPIPCQEGTFRSAGLSSSLSCVACPVNFFNARTGQEACLPCGSEAGQPQEGQDTCVCLRQGRVFQPSDAQCPCAPGYKSLTEDRRQDCVKLVYDICRDDAIRNQDGHCLTKEEWPRYCSEQVCDVSKDYQGYDKVLGLCLCQAGSLGNTCGLLCRRRQRDVLNFFCDQGSARLSMTYRNGSQADVFLEGLATSLPGLDSHAPSGCASENQDPQPVYIVKANGRGFLGVYDPEPEVLQDFFSPSQISPASRNVLWSARSLGTSWTSAKSGSRFYQPEPATSTPKSTLTGILNPTVCLKMHEILMFIVSKEHYPVYDVNNLYNTNRDFDWGSFRKLAEEMQLASGSPNLFLFFHQFYNPGTYVLRLSTNEHKKMYVRILPFGGQCYEEGPFYPTTPSYVVQVGIAKIPNLVLKPDWPAIIGIITGLVFLLLTYLILIILCQAFGWARKDSSTPRFRKLQLKYNLDKYSSRGSKIVVLQKYQSGMQARVCLEKNSNHVERREDQCKRWDSEEHIDLDSFNTHVFFEILLTQSLAVTTKLSQFKEELKSIYFKLLEETASLRDLWVAKLCLPDGGEPSNDSLMEDYMKAKEQAEEEIGCRRHRAVEYENSLNRQINLLTQDLKHEEEHWVAFNSALQKAVRQVEMLEDVLSREDLGSNSKPDHQRLLSLIDATSETLTSMVIKESHRLMQWGILGEGTGAGLLNEEKTMELTKEELVGGCLKTTEILHQDVATGLIMPNEDATMLLANQSMKSASPDHFLHPGTGKLLPVAGNVGFDPTKSKLIPVVDLVSGEIHHHSELPIFPFVPYPVCPETGLPGRVNLPVLQLEKVFKFGGLMQDPVTGMEVPILAITIHPQTGQQLTLGGTYLNPLTRMVSPLEIRGPMKAQESGKIVPILGITLDNNTGDIVPIGGLQGPSGDTLLPGDPFVEPLSGKMACMQGLSLQQDKIVPHAGSYQVLLEANVLATQILVVKAMQEYKDFVCKGLCRMGTLQKVLKEAEEAMKVALSQKLDYLMYQLQNLEKRQDSASCVKRTGGKLGMIKYLSTERWIPAVFGMKIPDPGGSELMVPILGVECDWKTGQPIPLAGVTEDADGKGLVPITIGFRAIDPITGEMGPVIGAQINPWTKAVLPVVQFQGSLPRENIDTDLLAALAKELMAKRVYWRSQREKEQEIFQELDCLCRDTLDAAKEGKMRKFSDKLKPADKICHLLELSSAQESQRQADRDLTALGNPERTLWLRVAKDEKDQEAKVQLLFRKTLEKLVQFIRKMQLEEGRIQMQLKETERRWSKNFCAQEATQEKFRKTKLHLLKEFQDHIAKQQTRLETEYCRLEYLRFLTDIVAFQTKEHLSGSSQCFMNYPGARFYSMAATPCGSWEVINKQLIPLLKSVVKTLEENKRGSSSSEEGLESGGYSSRSTMKVSEAPRETLRTTETRQVKAPAAALSPILLDCPAMSKTQLLQEIQTRIFLEKHAREMVQLELSLMAEEIHMISCFWESSQLRSKQGREGKQKLELASEWDNLLKELVEYHQHTERDLVQLQQEEVKRAGLCPMDLNFKDGASIPLEEILQHLSALSIDLQRACSLSSTESAQENTEAPRSETKLCNDPAAQKIEAIAVKIVKEEALKLLCVYQALDAYVSLQKLSCPRDVLQALEQLCYTSMGEAVSQDVLHWTEGHQVEGAKSFLQKHHRDGDLTLSFKETDEVELMELQAQIRAELRAQLEEKLESKETEIIQEAAKLAPGFPVEHVTFFILSQRHLRQAVLLWESGLKVPQTDVLLAGEGRETILHLLKGRKEWEDSLLDLRQAVLMLQLKENQFREMIWLLRAESSKEDLEGANQIANHLQEFRQQKIKQLAEQLKKLLLTGQNAREDSSEDSNLLQGQDKSSLAEDKVLSLLAEKTKILKQTEFLVTLRLILLNPHFRPLQSDDDEVSNVSSSQLLTLLKDVNGYFEKYATRLGLQECDTDHSFQDILDVQMVPKSGELIPLLASSLSAREFVIYQYGIVILKFLQPYIGAPEVELCLASSIPSSKAPGNAFRNTFYYQTPGNQLFVLRESLTCAGSFVLLLAHCLAHITANDFSQDSSPAFQRLFYQALKACLGEMFSLRLQVSAFLEDSKSAADVINQAFLKSEEASADENINLSSELLDSKAKGCGTSQKINVSGAPCKDALVGKICSQRSNILCMGAGCQRSNGGRAAS